jgi:hypothetical protein
MSYAHLLEVERAPSSGQVSGDAARTTSRLYVVARTALRWEWAGIIAWTLAFRALSAVIAFFVNVVFPLHQREQFTVLSQTHHFWDAFARWDSGWYNAIARGGYEYVEGGRNTLAFFPVYPMLMRMVAWLLGGRPHQFYQAGILISWASFAVAMLVLYRLARLDVSKRAAERAVLLAGVFPFAFFFGMVYTESLFLMLLVSTVYALRTRRWIVAALAGALLTATRVNGIMAMPALVWIAWTHADNRHDRVAGAAAALCASTGLVAYSLYVLALSGSPVEWYHSITRWSYFPGTDAGSALMALVVNLAERPYEFLTTTPGAPIDTLNGLAACAFLAATPFIATRLGFGYALLIVANLALPISSGALEGLGRYSSVLFPMFIWLGSVRSVHVQRSLAAAFGMLYLLCLALFVNLFPLL